MQNMKEGAILQTSISPLSHQRLQTRRPFPESGDNSALENAIHSFGASRGNKTPLALGLINHQ